MLTDAERHMLDIEALEESETEIGRRCPILDDRYFSRFGASNDERALSDEEDPGDERIHYGEWRPGDKPDLRGEQARSNERAPGGETGNRCGVSRADSESPTRVSELTRVTQLDLQRAIAAMMSTENDLKARRAF